MIKTLILSISLIFIVGCDSNNIDNKTSTKETQSSNNYKNTHAYLPHSPYANAIEKCALIEEKKDSCTLSQLPLLGQISYSITKNMILERLLVSHQWMGDRFAEMLDRYSQKMIQQLFRATTAIVIDDDIIPAYYWAVTGAIYLDPHFLWISQNEKETITKKDDYRSDFGNTLLFLEGTVYRKDGNSLYTQDNISRSLYDVELSLAGLLYHELTHANDFIPPHLLSQLDNEKSVLNNIIAIENQRISKLLYAYSPIESETLKALGQVLYHGKTASAVQKQLTGVEVGNLFNDDVSDAMYAYSTPYEDTAMLMQSAMMKYFYNVDSFQIFLNADAYNKGESKLEWGVRNPFLKLSVRERAVFVANYILPISNGWSDLLYGIADSTSLLSTYPRDSHAYMGNSLHINPKELTFNKSHKLMDF